VRVPIREENRMRYARCCFTVTVLASVLLNAPAAAAQQRALAFGDVPFGSSPATVLQAMKALQLEAVAPSTTDSQFPFDQRFQGELKEQGALVTAIYDQAGRLEKMLVTFLTADEDCVPFYRKLKTELQEKYGKPVADVERWEFPYEKGGHLGQEHIAIRVGKGLLAAAWDSKDSGSSEGGVAITTVDNLVVRLAYESSRWVAESTRRKKILDDVSEPTSSISTPPLLIWDGAPRNASVVIRD
jgi:hypothetical protein